MDTICTQCAQTVRGFNSGKNCDTCAIRNSASLRPSHFGQSALCSGHFPADQQQLTDESQKRVAGLSVLQVFDLRRDW